MYEKYYNSAFYANILIVKFRSNKISAGIIRVSLTGSSSLSSVWTFRTREV